MTTQQLYAFTALYVVVFIVVAILTRATARRIVGALAGGLVAGVALLGVVQFCEYMGWWRMELPWEPHFLTIFIISMAIGGFVFLLTWRIARRFGWRGLAVTLVIAAVLGPVRDQWYMNRFPEWGSYAPGIAPILAISAAYVILGVLGHATMRFIAGPAAADPLARRPWESA
jgi:hypothetical protein